MEAISSLLIATQHSKCQDLSLSWLTAMVPLLTFSWLFVHFSLLVVWWLLCTAGKSLQTSLCLIYSLTSLSLSELLSLSHAVLSQSPLTQKIQSLEWFCISLYCGQKFNIQLYMPVMSI